MNNIKEIDKKIEELYNQIEKLYDERKSLNPPKSEYQICEFKNEDGAKITLICGGLNSDTPMVSMNEVVSKYVGNERFNQFIEIKLDNPWCRIITKDINQLKLVDFTNQKITD